NEVEIAGEHSLLDGLRVVREGLQPGESVVVDGVMAVRNGQKLDPKPLEEPKASEKEAAAPAN
ncbi:MAG TPA: hypothetical protein PLA50_19855, partial [Bacteroidia bacterium]|nr:hypothetical protein [Bacteroidia bacterium]